MSTPVTILMATRNGAPFIEQQLTSILDQSFSHWALWISDDGSDDGTRGLAELFRARHPDRDIRVFAGPQQGASANFLSLLHHADMLPGAVAFADQDDFWLPDKLERAMAHLADVPPTRPAIYGSRAWIANARLKPMRMSARLARAPSFRNALVQNMASGNTMVLSPAGADLLRAALESGVPSVPYHDWWAYQMVTGAGGDAYWDPEPSVLYRQHVGNEVGSGDTLRGRLARPGAMTRGDVAGRITTALEALMARAEFLTPENRRLLEDFRAARRLPTAQRTMALRKLGLYRHNRFGQAGFWAAALLGKL